MGLKVASPKAELNVLRGMCNKDPKISGKLLSAVDETFFHSPESVEIFQALMRNFGIRGRTPTYRILIEDPELSDEARSHFRDSAANVQSTADAEKAISILNKYRQRRGLYNLAVDLGQQLKKSKVDLDVVLHRTATAVNVIRAKKSTDDSFVHFGLNNNSLKLASSVLYDDNSEDIIPTGIEAFDSVSAGFARGSLVTIGANSGGGKSITASAIAVNMASAGYKVLLVPLEMSKREMTARIMANVANVDCNDILTQRLSDKERDRVLLKYKKWVKKCKAKGGRYTIFKPDEDLTIEEIMASVNAYDCDVVIIDYIGLLKGVDGDDQVKALGRVARYCKINAEVNHRVNILVAQVNDDGKIKYARAIAEHSSNAFIWVATDETKETGVTKVEQPKSRNSLSFPFYIRIDYPHMRVYSVDMGDTDTEVVKKKQRKNLAADV